MDVQTKGSTTYLMIFLGVLTFGLGPLLVWLQQRNWPRRVDASGMTTRGGRHIPWQHFTHMTYSRTRVGAGYTVERYDLYGPRVHVIVPTERLVAGAQVVEMMWRYLPEQVKATLER